MSWKCCRRESKRTYVVAGVTVTSRKVEQSASPGRVVWRMALKQLSALHTRLSRRASTIGEAAADAARKIIAVARMLDIVRVRRYKRTGNQRENERGPLKREGEERTWSEEREIPAPLWSLYKLVLFYCLDPFLSTSAGPEDQLGVQLSVRVAKMPQAFPALVTMRGSENRPPLSWRHAPMQWFPNRAPSSGSVLVVQPSSIARSLRCRKGHLPGAVAA